MEQNKQIEEMQALITVLRQQLHAAIDVLCLESAKVAVLNSQIATKAKDDSA